MNDLAFDLATPHGGMLATIIAGIAEFERELIQERVRSGQSAAKARGKRLGHQPGERLKSDRLAPKLALVGGGRSYRLIGRELGLSKNTIADIVKRTRMADTSLAFSVRARTVLSCPIYGVPPSGRRCAARPIWNR